jgi:tetratricopeptide (TPR) repeat protein
MRKPAWALAALVVVGFLGCASKEQTSLKIYVQQRLYDKAITQGSMALKKTPDNGDVHYFMGAAYFGKDNDLKTDIDAYADSSALFLQEAYKHFTKAKELAPGAWGKDCDNNIVSMFGRHYNRGVIASKKNDHATAALEYRLATLADPENYEGYYAHAAALAPLAMENKKNGDEAKFMELSDAVLKDLEKVISLNPQKKEHLVSAWQSKGEIQYQRNDMQAAQESYKKAVELDPENYDLMETLARRFFNAQDYENAANYFEQSLGIQERLNLIEPGDVETYLALASCYSKLSRRDEAIAAYEKALKIKPGDPDILYGIMVAQYKSGEAAEKEGRMDDAKGRCNKCIEVGNELIRLDPQRPEAWQVRGYCKRIVGDTAGAAIDLKKFNELRSQSSSR